MNKLFNQVIDISGNRCRYPTAENGVAFCFTQDKKYCLYALYTKRDLTENKIIEIDSKTYLNEIDKYKKHYGKDPIILFLSSLEAVKGITAFAKYKASIDNMTIEELLTPVKGENK